MGKPTDIRVKSCALYFLPVATRVPLKFGHETLTSVTCARVRVTVEDAQGRCATGWGETPLSVQWVWPGAISYQLRHETLKQFCLRLCREWSAFDSRGHPLEIGHAFIEERLLVLAKEFHAGGVPLPHLAALVCCSPFDIALYDAYGNLHGVPSFNTFTSHYLNRDLAFYYGAGERFRNFHPCDFFQPVRQNHLKAWHLVGGLDALTAEDLTKPPLNDGHPETLQQWITQDGLSCLKVKLKGSDAAWDWQRLLEVGNIALGQGVDWLSADFNCCVREPAYVVEILTRLRSEHPRLYGMLLYVEQPFPYELLEHPMEVQAVSSMKPLYLDESAHDWKMVKRGFELGWNGVALKTCKTITSAVLSACWARAHGMELMVQDLTNPMLAQIAHVQLARHIGTIMGVETNGMQFYPDVSQPEAQVHPGLFRRRQGRLDLGSLEGSGLQYGMAPQARALPAAACEETSASLGRD